MNSKIRFLGMFAVLAAVACNNSPHTYPPTDMTSLEHPDDPKATSSLLVDVKDGLNDSEIEQLGHDYGINLHDNSPEVKDDANIAVAEVPSSEIQNLINRMAQDPRVQVVEKNQEMHTLWVPNDPDYDKQWHMKTIGAEAAWHHTCGNGVTVAIVDTGVACYNENGFHKVSDLEGTTCLPGHNFVGKNDLAADDQMHGTHVAGTVAQTTNNALGAVGLAHCAKIMPVKVLSSSGSGSLADVVEGIRWAADHGAQVINLSLGGGGFTQSGQDAITHALSKGTFVAAAAGNDRGPVNYPAKYAGAFAVSATDANQNLAHFSSYGKELSIAAPGTNVYQQTICNHGKNKCDEFIAINGTSMATPHVAAAAALVMSQGVTNPESVKDYLKKSADDKGDKNKFGAGILNVKQASYSVFLTRNVYRVWALFLSFFLLRTLLRKTGNGNDLVFNKELLPGVMLGCFGLLPVAFYVLPYTGVARPFLEALLVHPIGEWDIPFAAGLHKYMPLANFLPVLASAALLNVNRARNFVGGFAMGMMAYLLSVTYSADTYFVFGETMLRVFALVNSAMCAWVAYAAFLKKPAA